MTMMEIGNGIWQFNEENVATGEPYVDAYLIVGTERALLADSLLNETGIYEKVREITDLPVDVFLTHGHGDHGGKSLRLFYEAGCAIYMDMRDYPILLDFGGDVLPEDCFIPVKNGKIFDLGGYMLEAVSISGHTPGSMVLLERQKQLLFSGDTIGSGMLWMQISSAIALKDFLRNLEGFWDIVKDMENLLVYPGHRNQSPVQLNRQYVKDTLTVTRRVVSGVWEGEAGEMPDRKGDGVLKFRHISYGLMRDFLYDPQNLCFKRPDPTMEAIKDRFSEMEIRNGHLRLASRFFEPETKEGKKYPLVIYLHGAGERGTDTRLVLANSGATNFASLDWQKEHPCYIFAPQCQKNMSWTDSENVRSILKALEELFARYPIDRTRVYITGLSMGGFGTWNLIGKHPRFFAAAMPICGGGDPKEVSGARHVPVWAFHAADDPVVSADVSMDYQGTPSYYGTRKMVAALRGTGNRSVHYTEYAPGFMGDVWGGSAHASWEPAYVDMEALNWLFQQTLETRYEIDPITPGVWHVADYRGDSFYVVEGKDKALVIDTGMGGGDVPALIRTITKLPFQLAVTHVHGDHMFHSDKFGKFYMSHKELPLLKQFMAVMMPESTTVPEDIIDIGQGDSFDLGGGVVIEVLELGGHTPGTVCFLDRFHNCCFTGDAVGSGGNVWMQIPGTLGLDAYKRNLEEFLKMISGKDLEELVFLPGHRGQEWGASDNSCYNPVTRELIRDMAELCGMILHDDIDCEASSVSVAGEKALQAKNGAAYMLYTEENQSSIHRNQL